MKNEIELNDIDKAKVYLNSLIDSHEQELLELHEEFGTPNIEDFYYSEHRGTWILRFVRGEDQEFDTKSEMIEWIKADTASE